MRLDTTTDRGATWAIEHDFKVIVADPGASDVIDLCVNCAHINGVADVAGVEHPPYDDDYYICAVCSQVLDDINDQ